MVTWLSSGSGAQLSSNHYGLGCSLKMATLERGSNIKRNLHFLINLIETQTDSDVLLVSAVLNNFNWCELE